MARKPIIGIVGGIGSGKSFVAGLFAPLGGLVINSDHQVREAYEQERVQQTLRQWWGESVFNRDKTVNRAEVARRVFADEGERRRLEQLLHPLVAEARDRVMAQAADNPEVLAFVWDTPLLFETGLDRQCDALVFVEAPWEVRLARVSGSRGWSAAELERREKLQLPLDRKREMSDYVVRNTAEASEVGRQVREVFSRILAGMGSSSPPESAPS